MAAASESLTLTDGTVYRFQFTFSGTTALQSITDRFGNKVTIQRDSNLRIQRITSPNGRWLEFSYSGTGTLITQVRDSLGRTVGYMCRVEHRHPHGERQAAWSSSRRHPPRS